MGLRAVVYGLGLGLLPFADFLLGPFGADESETFRERCRRFRALGLL